MFIVPIFQLRHNQRAKVRDKSEEAMQNCAGRGAFIIITISNKVTSIPNIFSKRLNSSLSQSIIIDLQVCEDVPTKACNTVNEQVWENRFWFRLKFQHILLATLVLILKLTWLWFHKTVTQDLSYAKNFTGLRDCLRRCLSSKLQFKSLTRKSLLLRFKGSKILDVLIQTSNTQAARPTYGRPSYGAPTPQCKRVPKQKCRNVPRQECNYVPQKVGFIFVLLVSAVDA